MENKYVKVKYASEPIGKERIVLYLTTFDIEAFEKDQKLEKIPTQQKAIALEFEKKDLLNNPNLMDEFSKKFEIMFEQTYKKQLEEMKDYIEMNRKIFKANWYEVK